ncbi:MAG: redoxin domain-containing protein [Acidimicrobiia bacterium]|nr:redoxin domain-containing protein [Acidimicrobiia bacterium]
MASWHRARIVPALAAALLLLDRPIALSAREPSVKVESLEGRTVEPLTLAPGVKAAVFVFVSVDCPISNRYAPEVRRLYQAFQEKGVQFTLVYPNPAESVPAIREHLRAYDYPAGAVRDLKHALVKHAQISVTPEVAVFTPDGSLVYRGRIDNRYVRLGVERPAATQRDLASALVAVLDGKSVREPRTPAVGCYVADFARTGH